MKLAWGWAVAVGILTVSIRIVTIGTATLAPAPTRIAGIRIATGMTAWHRNTGMSESAQTRTVKTWNATVGIVTIAFVPIRIAKILIAMTGTVMPVRIRTTMGKMVMAITGITIDEKITLLKRDTFQQGFL